MREVVCEAYPVLLDDQGCSWEEKVHTVLQVVAQRLGRLEASLSQVVCVLDTHVSSLYGASLERAWHTWGVLPLSLMVVPAGEQHKTRATQNQIEDTLYRWGCRRDTLILALGGGVVSDLAGFVAATHTRGVPWVVLPTTLMALVDAGLGGKTGINTPLGKNTSGAFHAPLAVVGFLDLLDTLPVREHENAWPEILKTALLSGGRLWEALGEERTQKVFAACAQGVRLQEGPEDAPQRGVPAVFSEVIRACMTEKETRTARDRQDRGERQLLNLGHTVGHALEAALNYRMSHGACVWWGLCAELRASHLLGYLEHETLALIWDVVHVWRPQDAATLRWEASLVHQCLASMACDKKAQGQHLMLPCVCGVGDVRLERHLLTDYQGVIGPILMGWAENKEVLQ